MPSSSIPPRVETVASVAPDQLASRLAGPGISLDYGAAVARVRSGVGAFARQLHAVYGSFPLAAPADFSDVHVEVHTPGRRRFWRPQAVFEVDRHRPFEPFALDGALPLFEWGVNWYVAQRLHQYLLLHAGVVALGPYAILMAAPPGSGKSTLTAALSLSGFRLLSDEFGVIPPGTTHALPMIKPVALKNTAVGVIREHFPDATIGPLFRGTRKGDVAHLAPGAAAVDGRHTPAEVRALLFPRWEAGAALTVTPVSPTEAFTRLGYNCFNYALRGPEAFDILGDLVSVAPAHELVYSKLDDAIAFVRSLLEGDGPR